MSQYGAMFPGDDTPFAWNRSGGATTAQVFGNPDFTPEEGELSGLGKAVRTIKRKAVGPVKRLTTKSGAGSKLKQLRAPSGPLKRKADAPALQARARAAAALAPRPAPKLVARPPAAVVGPLPPPAPLPMPAPAPAAPVEYFSDADITSPAAPESWESDITPSSEVQSWADEEFYAQELPADEYAQEYADEYAQEWTDEQFYGWADENGYPRDLGFLKNLFKGAAKLIKKAAPIALSAMSLIPGPVGMAAGGVSALIPTATNAGKQSGEVKAAADGSLSAKIGAFVQTPAGQGVLQIVEGVGLAVVDRLGAVLAKKVGTTWQRTAPIVPQPSAPAPRPAAAAESSSVTPLLIGGALLLALRK